jgi:hypothetical protein
MDNGNNWPAWSPGAAGHGTRQGHGNLVDSGTINITGNGPYYTNSFTLNSSLGIYCVNFQLSNGTDTYRHITGTCFGTNAIVGNNSGGNNTGGGNNSTSDAHCLILNNATINQTN